MPVLKSVITDIETLSKTRAIFNGELSFQGQGLKLNTAQDAQILVDAINKTVGLKVLRLEGNTIGPEAAVEIGKALEKQPKFERLIGNDIFTGRLKDQIPPALNSICGAIDRSGASLIELNFSDNAFGPIGLEALTQFFQSPCCYSLKELRIHNNGLGPEGARKLAVSLEKGFYNSGKKLALKVFVCGRNRLEYEGAKAISNTLKLMGSLEEIQMPQNGIRPNGIEFIAEACASNPELKVINFNDNTFLKVGAEWMSKAFSSLQNIEIINLGDCLLRSKGAVLIARALANSNNLKEVIMSFNEISLTSGVEIAKIMATKKSTLKLLDLNGNMFGEDGKLEIMSILEPMSGAFSSLSEDEGSEEEGEGDDDQYEEDEEEGEEEDEENSEVIVEEEDYDEVEDYGDYDDQDQEDEDEQEETQNLQDKFGSFNIVQAPTQSLFRPFNANPTTPTKPFQMPLGHINFSQTNASPAGQNLFSNLVANSHLLTNSTSNFDDFIKNPNLNTFKSIDEGSLKKVAQLDKFSARFLLSYLTILAKIFDKTSPESNSILKNAKMIIELFFEKNNDQDLFCNEFFIQFGCIKSEEKNFRPIELDEKTLLFLEDLFKNNFFQVEIKKKILNFLKLRIETVLNDEKTPVKRNTQSLIKCFN